MEGTARQSQPGSNAWGSALCRLGGAEHVGLLALAPVSTDSERERKDQSFHTEWQFQNPVGAGLFRMLRTGFITSVVPEILTKAQHSICL